MNLHEVLADRDPEERKIGAVDPTRYLVKYSENLWAALSGVLDEITQTAAAPVIEKYTCVLAGTTFHVLQPVRPDLGYGSHAYP